MIMTRNTSFMRPRDFNEPAPPENDKNVRFTSTHVAVDYYIIEYLANWLHEPQVL